MTSPHDAGTPATEPVAGNQTGQPDQTHTQPESGRTGAAKIKTTEADAAQAALLKRAAATSKTGPRAKQKPAARVSRWIAAGGALGASLGLVGVMSAAAQQEQAATSSPAVRRVVVVPQATVTPEQIVIVLPEASTAARFSTNQAAPNRAPVVTAPLKPVPVQAAPAQDPAPVTKSSGS